MALNVALLSRSDRPWFAVVLMAAAVVFVSALAPETEHVALMYHLYLPRLWLEAGRPVDLITERTSLYPLTWEMLNGAALVLGRPAGARLLHTTCLGLLILAVMTWVRSQTRGKRAALSTRPHPTTLSGGLSGARV